MKNNTRFICGLVLCSLAVLPSLNAADMELGKKTSIGIADYAVKVSYSAPGAIGVDDDFTGIGIFVTHAISDNFALRGGYYFLNHDEYSDVDAKGIDLLAYYGTGFATDGFKAYIGGGFFSEKLEGSIASETFGGIQINGGLGYNWERVSLDLSLGIRDASDYEDFVSDVNGISVSARALSGSFMLSVRF